MYNDPYYHPTASDVAFVAAFLSFLLFLLVVALISYAIGAWLLGRIFKKAGVPQWVAWVPVYNTWKLLEIGGQQGFWAIISVIPIVQIVAGVFVYISMFNIGKRLGKEDWFVLLAIFLPFVWLIWLAFDDSKWRGAKHVAKKASATK